MAQHGGLKIALCLKVMCETEKDGGRCGEVGREEDGEN